MSWHRHIWGARTRPPHAGDFCLSCPAEWAETRAKTHYITREYRPRIRAHSATKPAPDEPAN